MVDFSNYNKYCQAYADYVGKLRHNSLLAYPEKLQELADMRRMKVETLEKAGIFYIGDSKEMIIKEHFDNLKLFGVINELNDKPIYNERWIIPIKDICGNYTNLVGYKRDADVRYMYATGKYYSRSDDFYGAQKLKYIYQVGWVVVVEGITDCLALEDVGIMNSLATCGTAANMLKMTQLSRVKYGVVFIHDRDSAGDGTRKHWIVPRCIRLNIATGDKDIDAYLHSPDMIEERDNRSEWLLRVLGDCHEFLKKGRCIGGDMEKPIVEDVTLT